MLRLYRRHVVSCPHRSENYRRCQCPIYVKGTLAGDYVRKSLDMSNWEAAQKVIGDWQKDGKIGQLVPESSTTIADAVAAFLADCETRGLSAVTIKKYNQLLEKRLLRWATTETDLLRNLNLDALTRFRATWPDAPLARQKNQERLKTFSRWCVARGWVSSNVADGLSSIKVRHEPTLPFSADEMSRILDACDRYPRSNSKGYDNRARIKAFVLTLRWTGLRISDVVTLPCESVADGRVQLYTQKTGQQVYVPIPPECVAALETVREGSYFFWGGKREHPVSAIASWQRSLRRLFKLANVEGGHAHRFRDTFACELLMKGVDMSDVSILLGHASIKITEKHYAAWVRARQDRLESIVQRIWQTAPDPSSTGAQPDGGPAPQPTVGSASTAPASPRQTHSGSDDGPTQPKRATVLQFPLGCSAAR